MVDRMDGTLQRNPSGLALAWAMATGLVLLPARPGHGQAPDWEKVALPGGPIYFDPAWDEPSQYHQDQPARLAADGAGRLYFADGPRLHLGTASHWKTVLYSPWAEWAVQQRPLAAGSRGTVYWGELCSPDAGATWDSLSLSYGTAYAVLRDGAGLQGEGYDAIERSQGCQDSWTRVHMGRTYGHIQQFALSETAIFALPSYAPILVGTGAGTVWKPWNNGMHPLSGRTVRAMRFQDPSAGTALLLALNKPAGRPNSLVRLHAFTSALDTLKGALPDSAITSLWFDQAGGLWAGSRGQGIHVSRDEGKTFTAVNAGLGSLFVEALESTSDGTLYALTRDGLYRARPGLTGLRTSRPAISSRQKSRARVHLPGLPGYLQGDQAKVRMSVLVDGRIVILPAESLHLPTSR